MKRPHSAKHVRNYLAQTVNEDGLSFEQSSRQMVKSKKHMFAALNSSNDLSRFLPKKIQQDKEQLYHQTLQLKNALNQVNEENVKLRTKIALLQRQKDRTNKNDDQRINKGKSNNFINSTKAQKENGIINNLKKLVREGKQQNQNLQNDILKLKKNIKYTKINEIQIEKQTFIEQNRKISKLLQRLSQQLQHRNSQDEEVKQLQNDLNEKTYQLRQATSDNLKYQELLEEIQIQFQQKSQKLLIQDKKWQRNLAVQKRKVEQLNKHVESLKKQVKSLNQKLEEEKKKTIQAKKQLRPSSSRPHQQVSTTSLQSNNNKQKQEALQINQKLKNELEQAKRKLLESENRLQNGKIVEASNKTEANRQVSRQLNLTQQQQYNSDFQVTKQRHQLPQLQDKTQQLSNKQQQFITELKEILTLRMKYNRYPFKQLKSDIEVSALHSFVYQDLRNMLIAEPFSLNQTQANHFLRICYGREKIKVDDALKSDNFIRKLRLVVDDFELIDEEEEEMMLYNMAENFTKNRQLLQSQFKKVKNKNNGINKKQLVNTLKKVSKIGQKQINLALCYLSINVQNLQEINYQDFLDRFYINKSNVYSQQNSKPLKVEQDLSLGYNQDFDQQIIQEDELI